MWAVLGLLVGIFLGLIANFHIPPEYSKYVAIAILAALDSVVGAILASMQKTFDNKIFITGFFANAVLAAALTYLGNMLDVDISLAAIIVFGTRIFNNFATIRRLFFSRKRINVLEQKSGEEN